MLVVTLSFVCVYAQEDGKLTTEEKTEIATYMDVAWTHLEESVAALSPAQWVYKPADTVWSIAEIAEHLEKSEIELFGLVSQQLMHTDVTPVKEPKANTETVMEAITSRKQRIKTRPNLEPTGKYPTPADFLRSFKELRHQTLDYSQQTEEALRHHFVPFGPLGDLDGYQILMFMSGHLERHKQQIDEVKSNPDYPPA